MGQLKCINSKFTQLNKKKKKNSNTQIATSQFRQTQIRNPSFPFRAKKPLFFSEEE